MLGATWRLADLAHVVDVQIHQVAEGGGVGSRGFARGLAQIDPALGRNGPLPRVLVAKEGLADIRLFASDLNPLVARA